MTTAPRQALWLAALPLALVALATPALATAGVPSTPLPTTPTSPGAGNLCAPPKDTVPPVVSGVTFSTSSVSLSSGSRNVTITAQASDTSGGGTASGVRHLRLSFSGPRSYAEVPMKLTGGTAASGTWTGVLTIPKDSVAGVWTLREVYLLDGAGNAQNYDGYSASAQSPTDLRLQSGWATTVTATGLGTPPPARVPAGHLTAFAFTPATVDATKDAKTVRVTASFSGHQPADVEVYFAPNHRRTLHLNGELRLHYTSRKHWVGHLPITPWIGSGKAKAYLGAQFGRTGKPAIRNYDPDQLAALHLPSVLVVHSGVDTTPPTLKTLSFTPTSVNTTTGAQTVTAHATATDTGSGVASLQVYLNTNRSEIVPVDGLYPYPGIGYAQDGTEDITLHRSGAGWVGSTTFPECIPSGTWRTSVFASDRAGNEKGFGSKALTAAGLPGTIDVTSTPGDIDPPGVQDGTASIHTGAITLDFSEGVKNVTATTLTVFPLSPAATRFTKPLPITAIVCWYGATKVPCDGSSGLATSAILTVTGMKLSHQYEVYANLGSVTSQLTDGNGNPMSWIFPNADVTGS